MLSHNVWYHVLIFHLLIYAYFASTLDCNNVHVISAVLVFLLGVFSFSLIEYLLHRFLFHSEKHLFDNKALRYVHFVLHGIHHMLPIDPYIGVNLVTGSSSLQRWQLFLCSSATKRYTRWCFPPTMS